LTRLFLIRHAEAEGNIFRRAHGHFDGQIIGRGHKQIELLKERFKHEKIDAAYSSDLSRTCMTASSIYGPHGLHLNTSEQLREVNMGVWEDVAWGDIEHNYPEMNRLFDRDPANWHVAGSEGYHHVQKRMMGFILEIAQHHDGDTIAAFSHGFAIRSFICGILGIQSSEIKKVPYFDNTAVSLIRYDKGEFTIEYQGDNTHLSAEHSTFANQTWWRAKKERIYENLRFLPLNEGRDRLLIEQCNEERGKECNACTEFAALLADGAVGLLGLGADVGASGEGREASGCSNPVRGPGFGVRRLGSGDEDSGWIEYIYVKPELRCRNYGIQLIGQAVSVFRALGREKLRVAISADNPALDFFGKYEFTKVSDEGGMLILEKNIRNWSDRN